MTELHAVQPNQTLYVKNINDKIGKMGTLFNTECKQLLYSLFLTYGQVHDVVVVKTAKMRGQAFVVFSDVEVAIYAKSSLNGFMFFDKALVYSFTNKVIEFAKSTSRIINLIKDDDMEIETDDEDKETQQKSTLDRKAVLFVENLPDEISEDKLEAVFDMYSGYSSTKLMYQPPSEEYTKARVVAQVCFDDIDSAKQCLSEKDGLEFEFSGKIYKIGISFNND